MSLLDWFRGLTAAKTSVKATQGDISATQGGKNDLPDPALADVRVRMGKFILDYEARRDKQGRLVVYRLPIGDGGGTYEVAGINDRYHPEMAAHLASLIRQGRHEEAEKAAIAYMITYTDAVRKWSAVPAVEFYLRDCAFNRGPTGAARILQRALRVTDDGFVGPQTAYALLVAEKAPMVLLGWLRDARESYERHVVGRDERSPFWKGLVNRWNNAERDARTFL